MFLFDKEDFNKWISSIYSTGYTIVGYINKPTAFIIEIPIDSKNNKEKNEKCQDQ